MSGNSRQDRLAQMQQLDLQQQNADMAQQAAVMQQLQQMYDISSRQQFDPVRLQGQQLQNDAAAEQLRQSRELHPLTVEGQQSANALAKSRAGWEDYNQNLLGQERQGNIDAAAAQRAVADIHRQYLPTDYENKQALAGVELQNARTNADWLDTMLMQKFQTGELGNAGLQQNLDFEPQRFKLQQDDSKWRQQVATRELDLRARPDLGQVGQLQGAGMLTPGTVQGLLNAQSPEAKGVFDKAVADALAQARATYLQQAETGELTPADQVEITRALGKEFADMVMAKNNAKAPASKKGLFEGREGGALVPIVEQGRKVNSALKQRQDRGWNFLFGKPKQ